MNIRCRLLIVAAACALLSNSLKAESTFANYESPQSHSLKISQDGRRLYAVNTPANLLAVYSLEQPNSPKLLLEVAVGIEPISLAIRNATEVWVPNHISDSIMWWIWLSRWFQQPFRWVIVPGISCLPNNSSGRLSVQ